MEATTTTDYRGDRIATIAGRPTAVRYRMSEQDGELALDCAAGRVSYCEDGTALVHSPAGDRIAQAGDWIIRDARGDLRVLVEK